jgi:hypothetical protein
MKYCTKELFLKLKTWTVKKASISSKIDTREAILKAATNKTLEVPMHLQPLTSVCSDHHLRWNNSRTWPSKNYKVWTWTSCHQSWACPTNWVVFNTLTRALRQHCCSSNSRRSCRDFSLSNSSKLLFNFSSSSSKFYTGIKCSKSFLWTLDSTILLWCLTALCFHHQDLVFLSQSLIQYSLCLELSKFQEWFTRTSTQH